MPMKTCANCSQPMAVETICGASLQHCPRCGGAWLYENAFEQLLRSSQQSHRASQSYPPDYRLGDKDRQMPGAVKKLLLIATTGALALVFLIGLAGYFLIWPLVSPGLKSGTLAKTGSEAVAKEMKSLGVPTDIGAWATQTAKKKVDETLRNAVGLPPKAATGDAKETAAKANETEQ